MKNYEKGRYKMIHCNDNRREPADCVAADRSNIAVETVEYVTVCVFADFQPVRINDFVKNIRLDVVIDGDTNFVEMRLMTLSNPRLNTVLPIIMQISSGSLFWYPVMISIRYFPATLPTSPSEVLKIPRIV